MRQVVLKSRRWVVKALAATASISSPLFALPTSGRAQGAKEIATLPPRFFDTEENVEVTLARLFQERTIQYTRDVTLIAPQIAENGRVVPLEVKFERLLSADPTVYPKNLYIVVNKNRRPLAVTFGFTPITSGGYAACNVRMGESSPIQAIVEMSTGALHAASKHVNVVVGGCGG